MPSSNIYRPVIFFLFCSLFLFGCFSEEDPANYDNHHLIVMAGQSNMDGVKYARDFLPILQAHYPNDEIIVVKQAIGSSSIRIWYKGWNELTGENAVGAGSAYEDLLTLIDLVAAGREFATVTLIWHQGESDAPDYGDIYADALRGVLDQVREDIGGENLNYVIGRISDRGTLALPPRAAEGWAKTRRGQVDVANESPLGEWVDTDDLNGEYNGLHYGAANYTILGGRFAERTIALIDAQLAGEVLIDEPIAIDSDSDGIVDEEDPEPFIFNE